MEKAASQLELAFQTNQSSDAIDRLLEDVNVELQAILTDLQRLT